MSYRRGVIQQRNLKDRIDDTSYHVLFNLKSIETNLSPVFKSQEWNNESHVEVYKPVLHNIQDLMSSKLPNANGILECAPPAPWNTIFMQDLISSEYIQPSKSEVYFNGITIQDIIRATAPSVVPNDQEESNSSNQTIIFDKSPVVIVPPPKSPLIVNEVVRRDISPVPLSPPPLKLFEPSSSKPLSLKQAIIPVEVAKPTVCDKSVTSQTNDTAPNSASTNKKSSKTVPQGDKSGKMVSGCISTPNQRTCSPTGPFSDWAVHMDGGNLFHSFASVDRHLTQANPVTEATNSLGKRIRNVQDKLREMSRSFRHNKSEPTLPFHKESESTTQSSVTNFVSRVDMDNNISDISMAANRAKKEVQFGSCEMSCVRFNLPPTRKNIPTDMNLSNIDDDNPTSAEFSKDSEIGNDRQIALPGNPTNLKMDSLTYDRGMASGEDPTFYQEESVRQPHGTLNCYVNSAMPINITHKQVFEDVQLMEPRRHKEPIYRPLSRDKARGYAHILSTNPFATAQQLPFFPPYQRCRHGYRAGNYNNLHFDSFINEVPSNLVMDFCRFQI